ncbi:MAG: hypothetical protein [Arizlama microvirus]|nr:MAG: hypothetical protein [Arizlama microvirus]
MIPLESGQTIATLDVNGLTDTKKPSQKAVLVSKTKKYVAPNGKKYKSEYDYVKKERRGE